MLYAGSKDAIKNVLLGIMVHINATDFGELSEKSILEKANKLT